MPEVSGEGSGLSEGYARERLARASSCNLFRYVGFINDIVISV